MKEYIIKEGNHSSGIHFGVTFKNSIEFTAMFDASCQYEFAENDIDIYDVNKLFGYSTSWFHHIQSARIGWRCIDGTMFEILTYSYNGGKRSEPMVIGIVGPDQPFTCTINDVGDFFLYTFKAQGDKSVYVMKDAKSKNWFPFKYYLYPYFGGNKVAPHRMHIAIDLK